jgi:hypothetical protein
MNNMLHGWDLFWDGHPIDFGERRPCWECETDWSLNTAHPNYEIWFCNPECAQDWASRQALENLLYKRALRRQRG